MSYWALFQTFLDLLHHKQIFIKTHFLLETMVTKKSSVTKKTTTKSTKKSTVKNSQSKKLTTKKSSTKKSATKEKSTKTLTKNSPSKKSSTKKLTSKKSSTKKSTGNETTVGSDVGDSVAITTKTISSKTKEPAISPHLESVSVVDNATTKSRKEVIKSVFAKERVITEASDSARELFNSRAFGIILDDGKVQLSLTEALYLLEKKRIVVLDGRNKPLSLERFVVKANKVESNFWIRYAVYKDMRNRGYVVKTALKFGADFRVYDRGIKPGEDHARWIVYPVHEADRYTWFDFAAKNRVAHSTKKRLLMGVVDNENDVTYWEVKWVRP